MAIADAFVGLPIESLILDPLLSAAKGQAALAQVTLDFVEALAFEENDGKDNTRKAKLLNIDLLDTQCGFKLYPCKIGKFVFSKITQYGYIHDIEICVLLKKHSIKINELPVKWQHVGSSKLNVFIDGTKMMYQLINLKLKN